MKKSSADDARYDRRQAADGQHHFVLKAASGEIIGTSERYTTAASVENGIASVKANARRRPSTTRAASPFSLRGCRAMRPAFESG